MNPFWHWIKILGAIWLVSDALILMMVYVGVYFVKPRWADWWKRNIADLDPSELEPRHQLSPTGAVGEPSDQPACLIVSRPLAPANEICDERSQMVPVTI